MREESYPNSEPFTEFKIPKGHYNYNQMKVLLIEGVGGNIKPYESVLKRVGITGRPEVELTIL